MTGAFDQRSVSWPYNHPPRDIPRLLFDIYLIPQITLHSQAFGLISIIMAHCTRFVSQISPPITTIISRPCTLPSNPSGSDD